MESKLPSMLPAMTRGSIVLVGSLPVENLALDLLFAEFDWAIENAPSLDGLAKLNRKRNLVAVLFNPQDLALTWEKALQSVLHCSAESASCPVPGFADRIDWPQVAESVAFHSLLLPFRESEFRHTLGFISGAKRSSSRIQMHHRLQLRKPVMNAPQARAAGIGA